MGDHHHGLTRGSASVLQELQDGLARGVIQSSRRLIAEEQLGVLRQGPGDGHPLLLTARELTGEIAHPVPETYFPKHLISAQRVLADLAGKLYVLSGRKVLHQVIELEDEPDIVAPIFRELLGVIGADLITVQEDGATGAAIHATQHVEKRRLARSRRPHDHDEFALFYGEGHIMDGRDLYLPHSVDLRDV